MLNKECSEGIKRVKSIKNQKEKENDSDVEDDDLDCWYICLKEIYIKLFFEKTFYKKYLINYKLHYIRLFFSTIIDYKKIIVAECMLFS